uniref:Fatty acyl-CoA reductase n=1 Tax=Heliothis virescens TaxID=7102 RepID=A0A2A4J5N8_HELVI
MRNKELKNLDKTLFSRLRDERPQDLNKIVPIFGDINLPNIGISKEDEETLTQKVFVHISTAYCNPNLQMLEEKLYPPPAKLSEVYKLLEQSNYNKTQIKSLLLSASLSEPVPGWVDSMLGATGIITAIVKGANRVVYGDADNLLDLIPVDYVANTAIVAAAKGKRSNNVSVYNCCTSSCNPLTTGRIIKYFKMLADKDRRYTVDITFTENKYLLSTLTALKQTAPAYAMDLLLRVKGEMPKYKNIQSKVIFGRQLLDYYSSHSWELKADRTRALHASLSSEDRLKFPCDPSDINWKEYTKVYFHGIEQFVISRHR